MAPGELVHRTQIRRSSRRPRGTESTCNQVHSTLQRNAASCRSRRRACTRGRTRNVGISRLNLRSARTDTRQPNTPRRSWPSALGVPRCTKSLPSRRRVCTASHESHYFFLPPASPPRFPSPPPPTPPPLTPSPLFPPSPAPPSLCHPLSLHTPVLLLFLFISRPRARGRGGDREVDALARRRRGARARDSRPSSRPAEAERLAHAASATCSRTCSRTCCRRSRRRGAARSR